MEMTIPSDVKELLELLNSHKVEYLIVGAYALALHGAPRFTGDLDIYLKPDPANASLVLAVLKEFGFGSLELSEADFTKIGQVIQLGVPPVRIDFLTSLTGLTWQDAVDGQLQGKLDGIPVMFLGKEQYIRNKRALGRQKDLADAEILESEDEKKGC